MSAPPSARRWKRSLGRSGWIAWYASARMLVWPRHHAMPRRAPSSPGERNWRSALRPRKGPGSLVVFEAALDILSAEQKFIAREFPRALTANELELHYQPIVSAQGARIVGVEALLRWTHATREAIPPATFIPVAEQMGLMDTLGAFVLRRALSEAKRWPELCVAVNLSPLQVRAC